MLETDASAARAVARPHASFYLARSAYRDMLILLGFDEAQLANGGSDDLIDAVMAWGDEAAIAARVREHFAAGADHVCLQPLALDPADACLGTLRSLAPALIETSASWT